jgi:dinuclear metal center YbgI/SA1388 family protein
MVADRLSQWLTLVADCYSPETAASWDSVGLQVGDPDDRVTTVMTSLDVTAGVLAEARDRSVDLIISHHPLLFRPLERLTPATAAGGLALDAARSGIALIAVHTNFDAAVPGTTEPVVDLLRLGDVAPLEPLAERPELGLGRIGMLPRPTSLRAVADALAAGLPAPHLRVAGELDRRVTRVAACGGAGDSLLGAAHATGAEVYVTGDLRHHPVLDALQLGMAVIDAGHHATEQAALPSMHDRLAAMATTRGLHAGLLASGTTTDPWSDYCAHHQAKAPE